jgi:molecular chaperone DnaJ
VEAAVQVTLEDAAAGGTRLSEVDGRRLEVAIPAGVESGSRIRLRGLGGGSGAAARDLVLVIAVRPHAVFTRDGANLTRDLAVTLREALLGAEVPVPTLGGKQLLLKIPAGTQPGRVIRLAGQGMPRLKGGDRGDLLVRVRAVLPALDERGRAAATVFLDAIDQPDPRQGA